MEKEQLVDNRLEKRLKRIRLPQGTKPMNMRTHYVCARNNGGFDNFIPMVSASLEKIIDIAFPLSTLPKEIEYRTEDGQCDDLIAFYVHSEFRSDGFAYEIDYFLSTGDGGLRCMDDPVPDGRVNNVSISRRAL